MLHAKTQLGIAKNNKRATLKTFNASKLAENEAGKDYQAGKLPLSEWLRTQEELQRAEMQWAQSQTQWIMAIANYKIIAGQSLNGKGKQ